MDRLILTFLFLTLLLGCEGSQDDTLVNFFGPISAGVPAQNTEQFEERLETIRRQLRIPGMSAAIAKDGKVVWTKALGLANVEREIPATPASSFHVGQATETFGAIVVLRLVEEGKLDIDDNVVKFGVDLQAQGLVRVKHLLAHTSDGIPGAAFEYNAKRYDRLEEVIANSSGRSFGELLVENIIKPLQLLQSAPNVEDGSNFQLTGYDDEQFKENLASGYASDGKTPVSYSRSFGIESGLISSVMDLSKYSSAIDDNTLLAEDTKAIMFNPTVSIATGDTLPFGLGWFVHREKGVKLVWHYGEMEGGSSLLLKVPDRNLSFIVLANTEMLSRAYPKFGNDSNVLRSVVAEEFLNAFVFGDAQLPQVP